MDNLARAFYEMAYKVKYLELKGNAFQDFFSDVMEKRYPGDFVRVRPWGNLGDKKNDGYLKSTKTLFQVYAPNEMSAEKAIEKIREDFGEAIPFWNTHVKCWKFVHNAKNGLGPTVTKELLDLSLAHKEIEIASLGYEELHNEVFGLDDSDVAAILGLAPTQWHLLDVKFSDIHQVVQSIAAQAPPSIAPIQPVSKGKIEANGLSDNVRELLSAGMSRAGQVDRFFSNWHDPRYGDEVALAFNSRYVELRNTNIGADAIFFELHKFAGGVQRGSPAHEAATLAVLAYFFEQCDIFEAPRED